MAAISESLELRAGELSAGLVPEIGGSLAYFRAGGTDLMRPLPEGDRAAGNVLGVAMFPMVPYANRIAGNAFEFGEKTWRFEPNNPPELFNVHGTGWHLPWQCERQDNDVRLTLEHLAPNEPYSYAAEQVFRLTPENLRVTMRLMNKGNVAMPFGFGLHPWFERDPDVTIRFRASHFFMEGPQGVATERLRTPPELDYRESGLLPDTWRNNDYGGWDGRAEIRFPSRGFALEIKADPIFGHLMMYADPARPYFCLEPQSNAPTAFNRIAGGREEGMGVTVLAPGKAMSGSISFRPVRI